MNPSFHLPGQFQILQLDVHLVDDRVLPGLGVDLQLPQDIAHREVAHVQHEAVLALRVHRHVYHRSLFHRHTKHTSTNILTDNRNQHQHPTSAFRFTYLQFNG